MSDVVVPSPRKSVNWRFGTLNAPLCRRCVVKHHLSVAGACINTYTPTISLHFVSVIVMNVVGMQMEQVLVMLSLSLALMTFPTIIRTALLVVGRSAEQKQQLIIIHVAMMDDDSLWAKCSFCTCTHRASKPSSTPRDFSARWLHAWLGTESIGHPLPPSS